MCSLTFLLPHSCPSGKGTIQTYFLDIRRVGTKSISLGDVDTSSVNLMADQDVPDDLDPGSMLSKQHSRLVDWHTETLSAILKQIQERRVTVGTAPDSLEMMQKLEKEQQLSTCRSDTTVLDEVVEIVTLPEYDANADTKKSKRSLSPTELDPVVVQQLQSYIRHIAGLYRPNAFHSFEVCCVSIGWFKGISVEALILTFPSPSFLSQHASHVTGSVVKLLSRIVAPNLDPGANGRFLHDHTYGITSSPLYVLY